MAYIPQVSPDRKTLRSGALVSSFDSSPTALRTQRWNQAVFYFDVTLDTATDVRVRFDVAAPDSSAGVTGNPEPAAGSSDWCTLSFQDSGSVSTSGAVSTVPLNAFELKFTASGSYAFPLPLNYMWTRVKAKATGTIGSATLTIKATTGMA